MSKNDCINASGILVEAKTKKFIELAGELTRTINEHVKKKSQITVGEIERKAAHRDAYEIKVDELFEARQKYLGKRT